MLKSHLEFSCEKGHDGCCYNRRKSKTWELRLAEGPKGQSVINEMCLSELRIDVSGQITTGKLFDNCSNDFPRKAAVL